MYYAENRFGKVIKRIFFIGLLITCFFLYLKGCSDKENFNKERSSLNKDVKTLQSEYDSLQRVSTHLKSDYDIYQDSYVKDSIKIDSLNIEIDKQADKASKMETKAKYYLNKFIETNKKINLLENNKNYKSGDSLLKSLSNKLN